MLPIDFPSEDDAPQSTLFGAIFFAVVIVGAFSVLLSLTVFIALVPVPIALVAYWPDVQGWLVVHPYLRLVFSIALVAGGVALYHFRERAPRIYASLELIAAVGLGWSALGSKSADRLAIGLALATTCYVIVRAVTLFAGTMKRSPPETTQVAVHRQRIKIYKGDEILADIPKDLDSIVYKIHLEEAVARIRELEQKCAAFANGKGD